MENCLKYIKKSGSYRDLLNYKSVPVLSKVIYIIYVKDEKFHRRRDKSESCKNHIPRISGYMEQVTVSNGWK